MCGFMFGLRDIWDGVGWMGVVYDVWIWMEFVGKGIVLVWIIVVFVGNCVGGIVNLFVIVLIEVGILIGFVIVRGGRGFVVCVMVVLDELGWYRGMRVVFLVMDFGWCWVGVCEGGKGGWMIWLMVIFIWWGLGGVVFGIGRWFEVYEVMLV